MSYFVRFLILAALAAAAHAQGVFGTNLVVNGGAEAGTAASSTTAAAVASIPGWTRTGKATVLTYASGQPMSALIPGPVSRGKNYFCGGPDTAASTLSQDIDVTA